MDGWSSGYVSGFLLAGGIGFGVWLLSRYRAQQSEIAALGHRLRKIEDPQADIFDPNNLPPMRVVIVGSEVGVS